MKLPRQPGQLYFRNTMILIGESIHKKQGANTMNTQPLTFENAQ